MGQGWAWVLLSRSMGTLQLEEHTMGLGGAVWGVHQKTHWVMGKTGWFTGSPLSYFTPMPAHAVLQRQDGKKYRHSHVAAPYQNMAPQRQAAPAHRRLPARRRLSRYRAPFTCALRLHHCRPPRPAGTVASPSASASAQAFTPAQHILRCHINCPTNWEVNG